MRRYTGAAVGKAGRDEPGEERGEGSHLVGWKIVEGETLKLGCPDGVGEDMICCCKEEDEDGRGEEGEG